jgi:hypothetical protein
MILSYGDSLIDAGKTVEQIEELLTPVTRKSVAPKAPAVAPAVSCRYDFLGRKMAGALPQSRTPVLAIEPVAGQGHIVTGSRFGRR